MTQTPQSPRDWQKDIEMCDAVKDSKWLTLESSATAVWQRGGLMSTIWEGPDAEALQQHKEALPYWLQEFAIWKGKAYEAEVKVAAEKVREDAAEDRIKELERELNSKKQLLRETDQSRTEVREMYRSVCDAAQEYKDSLELAEDREQRLKEAMELAIRDGNKYENPYESLITLQSVLSTLYPDTPAQPVEEKLPEWTKVKSREDGMIYTIHDATETNNQFGYGVYRYRVKERLDTGFALHKKWFDVIADTTKGVGQDGRTLDTPAPKEGIPDASLD